MEIKPFAVEAWMNKYEEGAQYNIAETCVDSVSVDELFEIAGEDRQKVLDDFIKKTDEIIKKKEEEIMTV